MSKKSKAKKEKKKEETQEDIVFGYFKSILSKMKKANKKPFCLVVGESVGKWITGLETYNGVPVECWRIDPYVIVGMTESQYLESRKKYAFFDSPLINRKGKH